MKLCTTYCNVYCETGIHSALADPGHAARFVTHMDDQLNFFDKDREYKLQNKIMYGTDWFMPINESPANYLRGFLQAFNTSQLKAFKGRFFSGNACRYLKLEEQASSNPLLDNQSRQYLQSLVRRIRDS